MKEVTCRYGTLKGFEKDGCSCFFGIPYAKAPVGALRFRPPVEPDAWEGVREAVQFGHRAWQIPQTPPEEGTPGINYYREFYADPAYMPGMDEDCLFLNIWTPAVQVDEKLPVAVWIHGGAFMHGFGSEMEFDGEAFAKRGVILVTINYRVGALGFFTHPALLEPGDLHVSNYGILDQIQALRWVHDNIGFWGGDPDRVTVFGQSAGAMSVQTLVSSPLTRGLIHGAIMQSEGGYQGGFNRDVLPEEALETGRKFAETAGAETADDLRAMSPSDIIASTLRFWSRYPGLPFTPVVDGYVMQQGYNETVQSGLTHEIPYMIGSCGDDLSMGPSTGGYGPLYYGCVNWSLKQQDLGRKPSYVYYFDRKLPGSDDGAFHSAELWYVFETLGRCWRPMTDHDNQLADQVCSYWCNFIKNGDPNGEGLPEWLPCSFDNHHVQVLQ